MRTNNSIHASLLAILKESGIKKSLWMVILMVITATLDFISLASLLPLIFFIIDPGSKIVARVNDFLPESFELSPASDSVVLLSITVLVAIILKNIVSYWIFKVKAEYAYALGNHFSLIALKNYLNMDYYSFINGKSSNALNIIINYPLAFANNVVLAIITIVIEGFVGLLILAAIVTYNPDILMISVFMIIPIFILYAIRRRSLKNISADLKEKYPLMLKYALQPIDNFSEIRVSGTDSFFYQRFQKASKAVTDTFVKDQLIQSSTMRITEIILAAVICFLVAYAVKTKLDYKETLLMLSVYAAANLRLIPSLNKIVQAVQQITIHEHIFTEFQSLIKHHVKEEEPKPDSSGNNFIDGIRLENVTYAYPEGKLILHDVSLEIRKGTKVAFTGKSGEGKTTLILIFLRLLKECEGKFLVDNKAIDDDRSWRKSIGYIPQNPQFLDASIAENIAFGVPADEIDHARILHLMIALGLKSTIDDLPEGINTVIGERGIRLSGGQRQRISIARALYRNADILLLDEITNHLHKEAEFEIMNILQRLSEEGKTIVMVMHKLPDTHFFDSVYYLEKGKITEVAVKT